MGSIEAMESKDGQAARHRYFQSDEDKVRVAQRVSGPIVDIGTMYKQKPLKERAGCFNESGTFLILFRVCNLHCKVRLDMKHNQFF